MARTDDFQGSIAIHIHSEATNINAAGIVYGGVGHWKESGLIIRKEVAPRVGSLQDTRYTTTDGPGSLQGTTNETRSQVISAQGNESETSSQVRSEGAEGDTGSQVRSALSIENETSSHEKSAQGIDSETSSQERSTQGITKETSSETGCAHDAMQTSWAESGQSIETETAKLGSADLEGGGLEPPAGEETLLPTRTKADPGEETGHTSRSKAAPCEETGLSSRTIHARHEETGLHLRINAPAGEETGHFLRTKAAHGGCREEAKRTVGYQQAVKSTVPAEEESESCRTTRKPRQLSRAMKNSDKRQKDNDFHRACKLGDLDQVRNLSEDNLNRKDSDGRTGLMVAAYQGHRDVVELLVTEGADLTLVDKSGDTVLHAACRSGDISIVKCILSRDDLDVNSSDKSGMTPAMSAAYWGYVDIVKLLLRRGAKMQLVDDEGDTILHYACRGGHEDVVECIITADTALVNVKNRKGKTAVKVSKEEGHHVVHARLKSVDSGCYVM
ncbi:serine/threonine-protein phosphatase 6 regulatory ankyrin repeat subunit A-like [Haliotis asinina]|uniref:serine/threonine-protein phosphatase 6 regulatory ankyrin repeat subunit A-like n=1 Tax=Haliotis asinina TaxID=109174 RepID=UPI003531F89F